MFARTCFKILLFSIASGKLFFIKLKLSVWLRILFETLSKSTVNKSKLLISSSAEDLPLPMGPVIK